MMRGSCLHIDQQAQCSRQREQPVKMPRGMKGISPQSGECQPGWGPGSGGREGGFKETGRVGARGALWDTEKDCVALKLLGSHGDMQSGDHII